MTNIVVWSKNHCGYCTMVKEFLNSKGLPFTENNIESGSYTIDDLLEAAPQARTMPQVFSGKHYVGGYTETVEHFSMNLDGLSL